MRTFVDRLLRQLLYERQEAGLPCRIVRRELDHETDGYVSNRRIGSVSHPKKYGAPMPRRTSSWQQVGDTVDCAILIELACGQPDRSIEYGRGQ